jgi:hypothetical protein
VKPDALVDAANLNIISTARTGLRVDCTTFRPVHTPRSSLSEHRRFVMQQRTTTTELS